MTTTTTFSPTGSNQSFVVPYWVTSVTTLVQGASCGLGGVIAGGRAARWQGTIAVTPGETLTVRVGVRPILYAGGGWPDGGDRGAGAGVVTVSDDAGSGGGSSSLYRASTLLVLTGGGGGTSSSFALSGSTIIPPGTTGNAGIPGAGDDWTGYSRSGGTEITTGGGGATLVAGGAAGSPSGNSGSFGQGGRGASVSGKYGGGGGGGFYGGGGGGARSNGQTTGGGGGSSLASAFVAGSSWTLAPFNPGAGSVIFQYDDEPAPSTTGGRWHLGS